MFPTAYCLLHTAYSFLLWGRFKGKGAVGGMSPFPVADSPETTAPGLGSKILKETKEVMTEEESL
jgi:hypothetical protein